MRRYLFLVLTIIHLVACSKENPGKRVDPNSALGRRELMEERIEESMQKNKHQQQETKP